jgi:hypothetical protein
MSNLLRFLTSIFKGGGSPSLTQNKQETNSPALVQTAPMSKQMAAELSSAIELASRLLIAPTPAAVRDASLLLEEAQRRLLQLKSGAGQNRANQEIQRLANDLKQFRLLVEGALRVQWSQMRKVIALTQSYAPGGKVSRWQPTSPKVDLKV